MMTRFPRLAAFAVAAAISAAAGCTSPAPSAASSTARAVTPWGEPDLQGIWSRDVDIPLERPARWENQEFFSDAERAELDKQVADIIGRDSTAGRRSPGTERDVNS